MTPADLAKFEVQRRDATPVALAIEGMATVTDEMHRPSPSHHRQAVQRGQEQASAAVPGFRQGDQRQGAGEWRIGQALIEAKQSGSDCLPPSRPLCPDTFAASVTEAQTLARPGRSLISCTTSVKAMPRYAATRRSSWCAHLSGLRPLPRVCACHRHAARHEQRQRAQGACRCANRIHQAALGKAGWPTHGIDRRYYEWCACRSEDRAAPATSWPGSCESKDFDEYPVPVRSSLLWSGQRIAAGSGHRCDQYLHDRLELLEAQLATVNRMAAATTYRMPSSPPRQAWRSRRRTAAGPDAAQATIDQTAACCCRTDALPLPMEVDERTSFARHFTHLKTSDTAKDKTVLLTKRSADAINWADQTGRALAPPTPSCLGCNPAHSAMQTDSTALAEAGDAQFRTLRRQLGWRHHAHPSHGQNFRTGSKYEAPAISTEVWGSPVTGLSYRTSRPVRASSAPKVVNVGIRDSTYALMAGCTRRVGSAHRGTLHTDTAGFTDHAFGLTHFAGICLAPRIRDSGETKRFIPRRAMPPMTRSSPLTSSEQAEHQSNRRPSGWNSAAATSHQARHGNGFADLLRTGSWPAPERLGRGVAPAGASQRTLFILVSAAKRGAAPPRPRRGWIRGEARNGAGQVWFLDPLGESCDRSFWAAALPGAAASIWWRRPSVSWSTAYLEARHQRFALATARRWTDALFAICRRWGGSTSTWPAITYGAAAPRSVRGAGDRDRCHRAQRAWFNEMGTPSFPARRRRIGFHWRTIMENIALIGIDLGKLFPYSIASDCRGKAVYRKKFTRPKSNWILRHARYNHRNGSRGALDFMARSRKSRGLSQADITTICLSIR